MIFITLDAVLKRLGESQYAATSKPNHFHGHCISRATMQKIRDTAKQGKDPSMRVGFNTLLLANLCNQFRCLPSDILRQDLENDAEIRQAILYIKTKRNNR